MRLYLRILEYLRPYLPVFLAAVAASFLFAGLDAFSLALLIPFLRALLSPASEGDSAASGSAGEGVLDRLLDATAGRFVGAASDPLETVQALIVLILVVFAVKNVFDFMKTYLGAMVEQGVTRDIRNEVYDHLMDLDLVFFGRTRIGQIVSRLTHDVEQVRTLVTKEITRAISSFFELAAAFLFMVLISLPLTLLALVVLPGTMAIWGPMLKRLRSGNRRVLHLAGEVNAHVQETLSGIRLVKASASEAHERSRFQGLTDHYFRTFLRTERIRALAAPITEMVAALGTVAILWYGARLVLVEGVLTGPEFMTFVVLSTKLYGPVKYLSKLPATLQPGLVGGERVFEFLDAPIEIRDQPDARPFPGVETDIVYDRVGFGYREDQAVLDDVSVRVPRGSVVALVGPSGAGKSTMADLLGRFFEVTSGSILIDGTDIRRFQVRSLRQKMALCPRRRCSATIPCAPTSRTDSRRWTTGTWRKPLEPHTPMSSYVRSPWGTRPWSASVAPSSRADSGSGSPSRARFCGTHPSWSSTRPRAPSTSSPSGSSNVPSSGCSRDGRSSSSRTGCRPFSGQTRFSSSTAGALSSAGTTPGSWKRTVCTGGCTRCSSLTTGRRRRHLARTGR